MKAGVTAFASGLVFAVGLLISGMTQPGKVLGFLDFAGEWDPSLMFVMGGAVAAHFVVARRALRPGARPRFADSFDLARSHRVDAPLVLGAAVFGVGWGLGGYCPGPAITSAASLSLKTLAFVGAMVLGTLAVRLARSPGARASRLRDASGHGLRPIRGRRLP